MVWWMIMFIASNINSLTKRCNPFLLTQLCENLRLLNTLPPSLHKSYTVFILCNALPFVFCGFHMVALNAVATQLPYLSFKDTMWRQLKFDICWYAVYVLIKLSSTRSKLFHQDQKHFVKRSQNNLFEQKNYVDLVAIDLARIERKPFWVSSSQVFEYT